MTPTTAAIIVVLAIVGLFIVRTVSRSNSKKNIPSVTYVDETLLDLVRTKQISAATDYYQKQSGELREDAQRAIEYLVRQPDSLLLMVRLRDNEQAPLYMDDTLMGYLKEGRALKATSYYAKMTNGDVREAQIAVGALYANPEMIFKTVK